VGADQPLSIFSSSPDSIQPIYRSLAYAVIVDGDSFDPVYDPQIGTKIYFSDENGEDDGQVSVFTLPGQVAIEINKTQ
jgi:hypothetical protein